MAHVIDLAALPDPDPHPHPLIVTPGWGEGRRVFGPLIRALNEQTHRRTVFIGSPRWGDNDKGESEPSYPRPLWRLARNIATCMGELELSEATGIAHSASGVS
jgi:hypothetical protein